ncbi:MAG: hypothetical protein ACLTV2_02765 [Acutalibacter sp.]
MWEYRNSACKASGFAHPAAPPTDEAVNMVMERLEAMKDGKDD